MHVYRLISQSIPFCFCLVVRLLYGNFLFRNIKDISVGTIGDINQSSKELYREFSDGKQGLTKAEFTVEVQIPHNIERGPLLVTDIKRRVTAFVSPKERGYDVSSRKCSL
jgi:hypothetical protein